MNIKIHSVGSTAIAEPVSENIEITTVENALDLIGNADYRGARKIIIKKEHFTPDFFDLKSKIAGDILQKFSTYRMQMAIRGEFSEYISKSLNDFIYESNKSGLINFVSDKEAAIERLCSN